ncbi:MAG TPA: hypothetical protein VJU60_11555 [Thermoleophilaceae bacterium]|nr:hypothetical protein [Thermoleophilaceae bacterium]
MRKLFVLFAVGALVCAIAAATAYALQPNTVSYTVKAKKKGKASKKHPAPLSYEGILSVGTSNGTQPNVAPTTTLFFPKGIVQNAKYFPKCNPKALDGQSSVPKSCKKAVIGSGTAQASGGAPGQPINPATTEQLKVTAYNGLRGKQILLALNGSSPLQISNRVVVGTMGKGGGKFAYTVTFAVPADLQYQLGLQVALTHFDVKISPKTRSAKVHGKKTKVSYLAATKCGTLPTQTTVDFDQDGAPGGPGTGPTTPVTVTGTMKC